MTDPLRPAPDERSVAELLSFGVVNLDKPAGPSAHQVAGWVRDLADDAVDELDSELDSEGVASTARAHGRDT